MTFMKEWLGLQLTAKTAVFPSLCSSVSMATVCRLGDFLSWTSHCQALQCKILSASFQNVRSFMIHPHSSPWGSITALSSRKTAFTSADAKDRWCGGAEECRAQLR